MLTTCLLTGVVTTNTHFGDALKKVWLNRYLLMFRRGDQPDRYQSWLNCLNMRRRAMPISLRLLDNMGR